MCSFSILNHLLFVSTSTLLLCAYFSFTVFFSVSDFFNFSCLPSCCNQTFICFLIIWQFIFHILQLSQNMCLLNLFPWPVLLSLFTSFGWCTCILSCISIVLSIFSFQILLFCSGSLLLHSTSLQSYSEAVLNSQKVNPPPISFQGKWGRAETESSLSRNLCNCGLFKKMSLRPQIENLALYLT